MNEQSDFLKLRLLSFIGFTPSCFTLHRIFRSEKTKAAAGLLEEITELMKSNSWRIREKGFSRFLKSWPVFTNGAIHWFFGGKTSPAFDIVEEKFFEIVMPESIKAYYCDYSPLFEYQDSLCVFNFTPSPIMTTTVWVMKEYRKTESWNKLFTVAAPERGFPICIPRFGEVVFLDKFLRLVKYNSKGKMCELDKLYKSEFVSVFAHKESLIWPKCLKKTITCVEESNSILEPTQCTLPMKK